jgi:general secretion pathway protein K
MIPAGIPSRRGFALIMVLFILAMLSTIALHFVSATRQNSALARNLKEETASYYMAVSGYHEAVGYILADNDMSVDFIDSEGNFWLDPKVQPITGERTDETGEVIISISDENAKLNINTARITQLRQLFEYAGFSQDEINEIIDSILDWKDSDTEHHLSGAEDEYYEDLDPPYKAKNAFFDVPDEILLVKGLSGDVFSDPDNVQSVLPYITTFSRGTLNINAVSEELMAVLGLSPVEIEAILKQRNEVSGGFRFIPREFSKYGLNATASNTFKIDVSARVKGGSRYANVTAVVNRVRAADGYRVQTIYWREREKNTGS